MQVDEDKEARKLEAARAILAGRSFVDGDDDPFEGLGPQEIQEYIDKVLQGASRDDPFEVRHHSNTQVGQACSNHLATHTCVVIGFIMATKCSPTLFCHLSALLCRGNSAAAAAAAAKRTTRDAVDTKLHVLYDLNCIHDEVPWERTCQYYNLLKKRYGLQGMSPEEINEYTQKHGVPAQYA